MWTKGKIGLYSNSVGKRSGAVEFAKVFVELWVRRRYYDPFPIQLKGI